MFGQRQTKWGDEHGRQRPSTEMAGSVGRGKLLEDSIRGLTASIRGVKSAAMARHTSMQGKLAKNVTHSEARKLAREMERRQSFDPRSSTRAIIAGLRSLLHPLELDDVEPDDMDDQELEAFFNPGQVHFKQASEALDRHLSVHKPWYLINPEGLFRRVWDSLAAIVIYAVVIYVPIMFAYFEQDCCTYIISDQTACNPRGIPGAKVSIGYQIFAVVCNYFFLVDIILNFITGYVAKDGSTDYNLLRVWSHYITSWLTFDIISCIPLDCVLTSAANSVPWYNAGQYLRFLRAFGIRRRARGSPFRWVDRISDIRQEFSYSARRIVHVAFLVFVTLHIFACLLWFVVRVQNFPPTTWPIQQDVVDVAVAEQYLWSLFNVISGMIGLGYGAFPPRTWPEALVWCFAMVALAGLFAVVNGFIISAILSSASSRQRYKERMDLILTATRSRDLPEELRKRIIAYLKYKFAHRPLQDETFVWNELPPDMQAQVALASTQSLLKEVPLLANDEMLLERVALLLKPAYAIAGEEIIRQGWPVTTMYFMRSGFVDLTLGEHVADTLSDGHFFGEAALLCMPTDEECKDVLLCEPEEISNFTDAFTAVVGARALTNCEMFALHAADFHSVVDEYPSALEEIQGISLRYAQRIIKRDAARLFMHGTGHGVGGQGHAHGNGGGTTETGAATSPRVSAATYVHLHPGEPHPHRHSGENSDVNARHGDARDAGTHPRRRSADDGPDLGPGPGSPRTPPWSFGAGRPLSSDLGAVLHRRRSDTFGARGGDAAAGAGQGPGPPRWGAEELGTPGSGLFGPARTRASGFNMLTSGEYGSVTPLRRHGLGLLPARSNLTAEAERPGVGEPPRARDQLHPSSSMADAAGRG